MNLNEQKIDKIASKVETSQKSNKTKNEDEKTFERDLSSLMDNQSRRASNQETPQ